MRTIISFAVVLAVILGCVGQVQADNLADMLFSNCVPNCIAGTQCDDYCPKRLPCTNPVCSSQCDDYCPKRLPFAEPVCATTCDDYCAKRLPKVCCPPTRTSRPCTSCDPASSPTYGLTSTEGAFNVVRPLRQARVPNQPWRSESIDCRQK